ncbi:hypothetical protein EH222_05370 [candidate division KSB1 bacterium]|nr:MAG: hypothetical protein EH222_05370 [candidate division KSB1 bacterium]
MNSVLGITGSVLVKNAIGSELPTFSDEEEKKVKIVTRQLGKTGMNLPVVSFGIMRAYMYAYGYGETKKARQEIVELCIAENPCTNCPVCTVECTKGFNVLAKMADILQISKVPNRFLA